MKLGKEFDDSGFPQLQVEFTASTFRLLTDAERGGEGGEQGSRRNKGAKR